MKVRQYLDPPQPVPYFAAAPKNNWGDRGSRQGEVWENLDKEKMSPLRLSEEGERKRRTAEFRESGSRSQAVF